MLNRFPQEQLAILFGSCAKGDATTASDLDLAVQADQPLDAELSIRLTGDIAEQLGRPVDLIDLHTAGEPLLGELLKGRRLLGSDTSYARLITRHLLDAADFPPTASESWRREGNNGQHPDRPEAGNIASLHFTHCREVSRPRCFTAARHRYQDRSHPGGSNTVSRNTVSLNSE
mgnify:CR=1 FL=1